MNNMINRYVRQIALPEIGMEGQQKLQQARVLLIGVGGLGSPIALYLTGAGIGTLGIVDEDTVSLSNLQRQVLYQEQEIGCSKVECAAQQLKTLNQEVTIQTYPYRLTAENAHELIDHYDLVIDGCDNFATRYIIDRACATLSKPYVYGAIQGFEGQVSVFHYGEHPRSYTELYPEEEQMRHIQTDSSVIGITPAITGLIEANEVLKIIIGYGEVLSGKLWTMDLRTTQSHVLTF